MRYLSHPPLRSIPELPIRPMNDGLHGFVDATSGDDSNDGSEASPWRSVEYAVQNIQPGYTLYLREGIYYENIYCSVSGRADSPVTIRSYPGERAVIDASIPDFQLNPEAAWQPFDEGAHGEFRSTKRYPNIRDVVGMFGDSFIGLQSYWYAEDLRSESELIIWNKKEEWSPFYCGPGLWYDRATGYIHARLAHTNIANPRIQNYQGVTDPRKLPLIIAPFRALPLHVDTGTHLRFQDIILRGGGADVVKLNFGVNIEFDNIIILGGCNGLLAKGTGPFRMTNSAIFGIYPPWGSARNNADAR